MLKPTFFEPSQGGKPVSFIIPDIRPWARFWEKDIPIAGLFQIISNYIINQPYVDEPERVLEAQLNKQIFRVFHDNHDTVHAIRQYFYIRHFLNVVLARSQNGMRIVANAYTPEERACFEFATYCIRTGRTCEMSSKLDTTLRKRGADIFKVLALQLEFKPELIESVRLLMFTDFAHNAEVVMPMLSGFEGTHDVKYGKAFLLSLLFNATHRVDLVRCWNAKGEKKFGEIKDYLVEKLNFMLEHPALAERFALDFMKYAAKLCIATGTKVWLPALGFDKKNHAKTKAKCTKNVAYCLEKIEKIEKPNLFPELLDKPSSAKAAVSPAQTLIQSDLSANQPFLPQPAAAVFTAAPPISKFSNDF